MLVNGIRISGASGIFKGYNFNKGERGRTCAYEILTLDAGHFERQPYSKDDVRSIYHIRESSIRQLSLLPPQPESIFLSHDWPLNITSQASPQALTALLRKKPYFRSEVEQGTLGSPPLMGLMKVLKPRWWFSAHLHVGFDVRVWWGTAVASVVKVENPDEIVIDDDEEIDATPVSSSTPNTDPPPPPINPDEIALDDLDGDEAFDVAVPPPPLPSVPTNSNPNNLENRENLGLGGDFTQFVALDKCLPRRKFLEVRHGFISGRLWTR